MDRQEAILEGRDATVYVREYRFFILVVATHQGSSRLREDVAIVHSDLSLPWLLMVYGPLTREAWSLSGLLPCRSATAAALFLGSVAFAIEKGHQGWSKAFDETDRVVRAKVSRRAWLFEDVKPQKANSLRSYGVSYVTLRTTRPWTD